MWVSSYHHSVVCKKTLSSLFCNEGTTNKTSVLQANALRDRISPTSLGYSWKCMCHLFTYHRGPTVQ